MAAQSSGAQIDLKPPLPAWLRDAADLGRYAMIVFILDAKPHRPYRPPAQAHPTGKLTAAGIDTAIQSEVLR